MICQKESQISADQISRYKGQVCLVCGDGIMIEKLDHDAMLGNRSVLVCNKANPCGHRITIDK